jgi:hypothetical protein
MSDDDYREIKKRVMGDLFSPHWEYEVSLSDIQIDYVKGIVETLLRIRDTIEKPLIPFGDLKKISPRRGAWSVVEYSQEAMKQYVEEFFKVFLNAYRETVKTNFPNLKEYFPLYSKGPLHVIVEYYLDERNDRPGGGIEYTILKNTRSLNDEIEVYQRGEKVVFDLDNQHFSVNSKYSKMKMSSFQSTVIYSILEEMAIQTWCYEKINKELQEVFPKIT